MRPEFNQSQGVNPDQIPLWNFTFFIYLVGEKNFTRVVA